MADKMDERLRADLCGDMGKLRGLLAAAGGGGDPAAVLERARILTAINECPTIAKKTDLVQAALERADTDGTGSKMSVATALQQLSQHLLDEMDAAHVAAVQEACKNKRAALVEQTEARGSGGFVEAHMLRAMLQSAPFELQADVVGSVLRFFGVRDEAGDSVRTSEIMRKLCPMLDQAIFAGINAQVIDKYGSLKTAFDALSKDGKISRAQMSELIETLQMEPVGLRWVKLISSKAPSGTRITNARLEEGLQTKVRFLRAEFEQFGLSNLSQDSFIEVNGKFYKPLVNQKLRPNEVQDIVNLADADGSGSIEYQEFQIVFGAGEMFARQRQENYKKLQDKAAQTASVRTDSLFPIGSQAETSLGARMLSPEERVAEVILGPRESELRAALKDADSEGKGSVDTHKLQGAFNKLGLGLSAEDVKKLLSKAVMSDQTGVDYSKLIQEVRWRLSTASTLEEAQAEIVVGLRDVLVRKGDGKQWLVKAFQIVETDMHAGKSKSKMTSVELSKILSSLRIALSGNLISKLVKTADSDRKDGIVNYADFVRMLGESASKLRGTSESGLSSSSLSASSGSLLGDDLSDEMEEEIREVLKGKYETMTNAFRHFDKDKSGSISRQEMLEGLKRLQLPITDKQFGKIINRADADGGGSIDMNEFKSAFEMGVLAEAKRDADKQKKMGAQLMKERRESAAAAAAGPEEEVGEPDPKAEKFLWVTLQRSYSSIPEAFAFLKGRAGGKHADVLSEKELCNGLLRLHLMEQLKANTDEAQLTQLLRATDQITAVQKKDMLVATKGLTPEAARNFLKKAGIDEGGIRPRDEDAPGEAGGANASGGRGPESGAYNPFAGTTGKALFRSFNKSGSGWLTQGEFIHALSQWTKTYPKALESGGHADARAQPVSSSRPQTPGAPSPTKGGGAAFVSGPLRASADGPRSVTGRPLSSSGRAGGEGSGSKGSLMLHEQDRENNIWPAHTRDPSAKKDAHEMLEKVRRDEMQMLKGKLKLIRQQEERLQERNREADRREAQLKAQEEVLEEREARLLGQEKFVQDGQAEVKLQRARVEKMTAQLQGKLKEVEERAKWLADQQLVLAAREEQLQKLSQAKELDARDPASSGLSTGASKDETGARSSKERMAQIYRESLEHKRRAMNLSVPYASKMLTAGAPGAGPRTAAVKAANGGSLDLAAVNVDLIKERQGIADQMHRVEAMMKDLNIPPS